ncbi:DUF4429 domain-containing protein [Priestia megaterium]|uniref:DUF4429 domain-containing protein n=1 Tax=Priestia megaterium TaxID=1404 RepID=UPI003CFE7972
MFKGLNGQIEVTETNIIIRRNGAGALLSKGFAGDKTIPISAITAIQFKPGSFFSGNGFIKFCYGGSNEQRGNLKEAIHDDNAVVFRPKHNDIFESLKSTIEQKMVQEKSPQRSGASEVEQLERLARLKDQGHITEEEFQKKKIELL